MKRDCCLGGFSLDKREKRHFCPNLRVSNCTRTSSVCSGQERPCRGEEGVGEDEGRLQRMFSHFRRYLCARNSLSTLVSVPNWRSRVAFNFLETLRLSDEDFETNELLLYTRFFFDRSDCPVCAELLRKGDTFSCALSCADPPTMQKWKSEVETLRAENIRFGKTIEELKSQVCALFLLYLLLSFPFWTCLCSICFLPFLVEHAHHSPYTFSSSSHSGLVYAPFAFSLFWSSMHTIPVPSLSLLPLTPSSRFQSANGACCRGFVFQGVCRLQSRTHLFRTTKTNH